MPVITTEQIQDLLVTARSNLGAIEVTDLTTDIQNFVAMRQILDQRKIGWQAGPAIRFEIMSGTTSGAREVGLFGVDEFNIEDRMRFGETPWRHITHSYAIERREIAMNRAPAQIVNLMRVRRHDALVNIAELLEKRCWSAPPTATDNQRLMGVPYWICWKDNSATSPNGGFDGGDPYTGVGCAGVLASQVPAYQNWCARYTTISKNDLVAKWRRAATFCLFRPPVEFPSEGKMAFGSGYGYYANYNVVGELESMLESRNDNLGNDIATKDGAVMFRRTPVEWVPMLEQVGGNPIYGIYWGALRPVFLVGEWMVEEGPKPASNRHTTFVTHLDLTCNFICNDRRRQFVLATSTPTFPA